MTELTTSQRKERLRLEQIVHAGKNVFLEVGLALKELRDQRLFIETHPNFTLYAEDVFGLKKSRAYQLIEAVEVLSEVSTTVEKDKLPTNERQFREVAKAPPEKQVAVVETAAAKAGAEDREPTAKDYKEAREEVCGTPAAEPEYEDIDEPEAEPITFDQSVIRAFERSQLRLGTLRQLLTVLSDTEIQILKDWLA